MFKKDDKYQFSETSDSCKVIRGASVAPYPKTYKVDGKYLILDGYIKFITDKSSEDKLTLKAGIDEIREIIQVELVKPEYGHSADMINSMLKFVQGEVRLVLSKTN
ncbi:MAG: hypothetical protein LBH60_03865 [Prevotellaceae bacterium]|nr:hypothetical protein [Prevotellaceae bacterium]